MDLKMTKQNINEEALLNPFWSAPCILLLREVEEAI